ncbi:MAG: helix-turn-helix domain-containing protein [Halomonas sp.]
MQNTVSRKASGTATRKASGSELRVDRLRAALDRWHPQRGAQRALADAVGVAEQSVSRWIRDGSITRDHLLAVARALDVRAAWLAGLEDDRVVPVRGTTQDVDGGAEGWPAPPLVAPDGMRFCYAVAVSDARAEPRYRVGELLILSEDSAPRAGEDVMLVYRGSSVAELRTLVRLEAQQVMVSSLDGSEREVVARDTLDRCSRVVATYQAIG